LIAGIFSNITRRYGRPVMPKFNWNADVSYKPADKKEFHRIAKRQLKKLADAIGWAKGEYDLRSNNGSIAVSGEITLHHEDLYIQASQGFGGGATGLMIRTCEGRNDYTGGHNHFASLSMLDDENRAKLVKFCEQIREQKVGFNADAVEDVGYNPHYSTPRVIG